MDSDIRTLIPQLREKLAAHLGNPEALWENLPGAFEELTRSPLDVASPHTIMLCQQVVKEL